MTVGDSILIVDDDRDETDVALRAIGRSGIDATITVARDGEEALQKLGVDSTDAGDEPAAKMPSVVFLDLKMPRIDGFEVLRRMREHPRTADLPVVVFSRSDRPQDVRRSYELGANSFLVKRLDPRSPGAYIAEAVRYWLVLNRGPKGDRQ